MSLDLFTLSVLGAKRFVVLIFLLASFRIMGKREIAQFNIYDLAMVMAVANAVQNAMTGGRGELVVGFVTAGTLLLGAWLLTQLFWHAPTLEKRILGTPTVLVLNGVVLQDRMRRERISKDELAAALRQHGLREPAQAKMAILEIDGSISIVPKDPIA